MIAWGRKVSPAFRQKVQLVATALGGPSALASWLMACMAQESGETFSPSIRNEAGSGATGLIQFMPQTAAVLGTTTAALAAMSDIEQLDYVRRFFWPWRGKLHTLGDVYMAILWPEAVGKPDDFVLFDKADPDHPVRYIQNHGLDFNHDGKITRAEACARVASELNRGMSPAYVSA